MNKTTLMIGDCRKRLKEIPDESVHCIVTSPPYWGLRTYGGESDMIGMEGTWQDHLDNLMLVFDECWRVLRHDGTFWLNYGDAYWGGKGASSSTIEGFERRKSKTITKAHHHVNQFGKTRPLDRRDQGWKPKDLIMMPNRIALAMSDRGWFVRSEIVWSKPNGMPESVTDRPSCTHEKVFLFAKSARYYYDNIAVMYDRSDSSMARDVGARLVRPGKIKDGFDNGTIPETAANLSRAERQVLPDDVRPKANLRNVWSVSTGRKSEGEHFAVFPPELVRPCLQAGVSAKGVCAKCGTPWRRVNRRAVDCDSWMPGCDCPDSPAPVPPVVLDPFGGSGTVSVVAGEVGADSILVELNPEYAEMSRRRILNACPMFNKVEVK